MDETEIKNIPLPEDLRTYACANQHLPTFSTVYSDKPSNPIGLPKLMSEPSTSKPPLPASPPPLNPPLPSLSDVSHILKGKYAKI